VTYIYHQDANNDYYNYSEYDLIIIEHFCAQENVDDVIANGIDAGVLNSGKPFMFSAVYDNEFDFTTTDDDTYTSGTTHYVYNDSHHISGPENQDSEIELYNNPGAGAVSLAYMGSNVKSTVKKLVVENNDSTRTIMAAHETLPRVFFGASNFDNLTSAGWEMFERSAYWMITQDDDSLELYEAGSIVDESNSEVNVTRSYSAGTYNITLRHPATSNYNTASTTYLLTVQDDSAPTYSNITEPTDPSTYDPAGMYNFTIVWEDDTAVAAAVLEFNGINYTDVSNTSSVYYRAFTGLAAATHNYTWHANDTGGVWNNTGELTFTVSKASTTLNLTASPSWTETYGTQTTINCTVSNGEATPQLYRNGTLVSVPDVQTLAAGTYLYVCNTTSTQNYTNATTSNTLTINKASTATTLYLNSTESNFTATYGDTTNATATTNGSSVTLYRNGTPVSNPEITTLGEGFYNYTAITAEDANLSSSSATWYLTVQKSPSNCSLEFDYASPQTYGTQLNASCSCDTPLSSAELWRNNTDVTATENNTLTTIAAGAWSYVCNSSGSQNYTGGINTSVFTISKAASSVNMEINGTAGNFTIERGTDALLTAARLVGESTIELYRNSTLIASGSTILSDTSTYSSESIYNVTAYYPETQNYSASSHMHWLTVDDTIAPGPVTGLAVSNNNDTWIYWIWNDPADSDFAYTEVWLNGTNVANTTGESHSATGLSEYTYYTISLRTVDDWGTVSSTWTNNTQRTDAACTEIWVASYHDCRINDTRIKYYNDTNSCGTTYTLPGDNGTSEACDCVLSTNFNGTTTNLTGNDLSNLQDVVLEIWPKGTVRFQENISITRCIDIDSNASIGEYYTSLSSTQLPEFNKSANITIYNTNFTSPRIMVDGSECPSTTCTIINSSGGQVLFNVTHFTNYSIEESPYCGDGSCSGAENCGSCALDCGACAPGGGGGGGGGGSTIEKPCEPNWLCYSWGACTKNTQTRQCFDANACNNETGKPRTGQFCVAGCVERWACGEWGVCKEAGVQTRTCNDLARCKTDAR
jgi:hypothetical protein